MIALPSFRCGSAALVIHNMPRMLVRKVRSTCSTGISAKSSQTCCSAALFTRMSSCAEAACTTCADRVVGRNADRRCRRRWRGSAGPRPRSGAGCPARPRSRRGRGWRHRRLPWRSRWRPRGRCRNRRRSPAPTLPVSLPAAAPLLHGGGGARLHLGLEAGLVACCWRGKAVCPAWRPGTAACGPRLPYRRGSESPRMATAGQHQRGDPPGLPGAEGELPRHRAGDRRPQRGGRDRRRRRRPASPRPPAPPPAPRRCRRAPARPAAHCCGVCSGRRCALGTAKPARSAGESRPKRSSVARSKVPVPPGMARLASMPQPRSGFSAMRSRRSPRSARDAPPRPAARDRSATRASPAAKSSGAARNSSAQTAAAPPRDQARRELQREQRRADAGDRRDLRGFARQPERHAEPGEQDRRLRRAPDRRRQHQRQQQRQHRNRRLQPEAEEHRPVGEAAHRAAEQVPAGLVEGEQRDAEAEPDRQRRGRGAAWSPLRRPPPRAPPRRRAAPGRSATAPFRDRRAASMDQSAESAAQPPSATESTSTGVGRGQGRARRLRQCATRRAAARSGPAAPWRGTVRRRRRAQRQQHRHRDSSARGGSRSRLPAAGRSHAVRSPPPPFSAACAAASRATGTR